MRRLLGIIGITLTVGGATAAIPFFAALGAGITFTLMTLGLAIWRWIRRRNASSGAASASRMPGVISDGAR